MVIYMYNIHTSVIKYIEQEKDIELTDRQKDYIKYILEVSEKLKNKKQQPLGFHPSHRPWKPEY